MRSLAALVIGLFIGTVVTLGATNEPPQPLQPSQLDREYPLNFVPFLSVYVDGPAKVTPGQLARITMAVTNDSAEDIVYNDVELSLSANWAGKPPEDFVSIQRIVPRVHLEAYGSGWKTGGLQAGQTKTYQLTVRVPNIKAKKICWESGLDLTTGLRLTTFARTAGIDCSKTEK